MDILEFTKQYTIEKRRLFHKYYEFLNEQQREAVYHTDGPLLILAGAGSGKTTVLVNRLAHIIRYGNAYESLYIPADATERTLEDMKAAHSLSREELGVFLERFRKEIPPAWSVMAITFTNKAAAEIKERMTALLGEDSKEAAEIWTGTFHSVCMRILRRWGESTNYLPDFGICDADDSKKLLKECLKQLNLDEKHLPVKTVQNQISRAKDNLLSPEGFLAEAGQDIKLRQIAQIYTLYQSRLKSSNLLDFDDIIMQTVLLLQNNDSVREMLQNRFRYISVDEYQDTNKAQLVLTTLLSGRHRNIMVVGDDDQSIYKFRGATIENILRFDRTFDDAKVIKLEENYRSTKTILDAANAVISHNTERHGKNLWTAGEKGDPISVIKLGNQNDEARFIAEKIQTLIQRESYSFRSMAVLYRTNAQSRSIEQVFAKSGIPYRLLGGLRFYERMEVKDILAYLCVINNPHDDIRLERIINVPRRGIGDKSISLARTIAIADNWPLLEVLRQAKSFTAIPSSAAKNMVAFVDLIDSFRERCHAMTIADLIQSIVQDTGYENALLAAGEEGQERLENIGELVNAAVQYEEMADAPTLSGFLEEVALVSDIDQYDDAANAVVLMTVHSAKGLEFPVVFLPGMEEGLFPGHQTMYNPADVEEERRLAYVALTRAKKKIFITHTHDRMLNGSTQMNPPSRFLEEIPHSLIMAEDRTSFRPHFGRIHNDEEDMFSVYAKAAAINSRPAPSGTGAAYKRPAPTASFQKKAASAQSVGETFSAGTRIRHATFGCGTVLSVRAMGGDILYEIAFDDVGTKKLMATYAKLIKL